MARNQGAAEPAPSAMSVDEAIEQRRSIRRYHSEDVPASLLREILDLARRAPTSMNGQGCHFVVVREPASRRQLAEIKNRYCPPEKSDYPADFLNDAPAIVVVCAERSRSFEREVENAVLAAAFLLLVAQSRGLGSVFLTAYRRGEPRLAGEIAAVLSLPPGMEPVCLIPLGLPRPEDHPPPRLLRPLQEIVHDERFDGGLPLCD